MKVIAFNGSGRKDGNTSILINVVFEELKKHGIEHELINLAGKTLRGCTACGTCYKEQNKQCVIKGDEINEYIEKMLEADAIILGSPVYFANVTAELKALIDRTGFVAKANGDLFKHKLGAAVVAVRRAGAVNVFNSINDFFLINQMIIPGANYWNIGYGLKAGDVENDEEGIATMETLGKNMAWLLKKINM